jgi:hypothetical protein
MIGLVSTIDDRLQWEVVEHRLGESMDEDNG